MLRVRLDDVDWRILRELQEDARITNVELARRIGLSPPPCLRRVRALEEAGVITGYRTLLDSRALGLDITAFALVGLAGQSERDLLAFEAHVAGWPLVRESHLVTGEFDFLLKCVATDFPAFQSFVLEELTAAENVDSVRTALVIRKSKDVPDVPVA